jgi:molybdopterin adenylyltransferase
MEMKEFTIGSINISEKKGVAKTPVKNAHLVKGLGIKEDAHKGMKNREVSLLAREEIDAFWNMKSTKSDEQSFEKLPNGSFGENITTKDIDLSKVKLLDYIQIGNSLLQISKIGKQCHDRCHIYHTVGDCIMPKKGIFAKVLKGGVIHEGQKAKWIPKKYKITIITLSDRASKNEYEDKSGESICEKLKEYFSTQEREVEIKKIIIPDSKWRLFLTLLKETNNNDIIITTGGTGIGPRDITIEIMQKWIKKELPGITEYIRTKYGQSNKNALISRSIIGVRNKTLLMSFPGSVKAVNEYLSEITPMFNHIFRMLYDLDMH